METKEIKMPPKQMLSTLFYLYGWKWSLVAFSGVVVFLILGFALDFRFFFLSLIWIFLFIPLVVTFLYFFYGMKPLTTFNTIPHTLLIDNQFIQINFTFEEKDGSEENKFYKVDWSLFKEFKNGSRYFILCFQTLGWIWIPFNTFEKRVEIDKFLNLIANKTTTK